MSHDTSISKEVRETFPSDWPKWVLKSLTELSRSENLVAKSSTVRAFPLWVQNMCAELVRTMLPSPQLPSTRKPYFEDTGPEFLGSLVGNQDYLFESKEAEDACEAVFSRLISVDGRIDQLLKEKLPDDQYKLAVQAGEEIIEHWCKMGALLVKVLENKVAAMRRCQKRALHQSFEERRAFFKCYAKAAYTPLFNESSNLEHATSRTGIFAMLIIFYPFIEKRELITSIRVLHGWLVNVLRRPDLSFDVVRKICNENKLSFAEDELENSREK
jgi:hypothetical protein